MFLCLFFVASVVEFCIIVVLLVVVLYIVFIFVAFVISLNFGYFLYRKYKNIQIQKKHKNSIRTRKYHKNIILVVVFWLCFLYVLDS